MALASSRRPSSNAARMRVEDTVCRLILGHRHDMHADAEGFAQLPQPFDIARRAGSEGEVIAAEQFLGVEALHQHRLDKILRRQGAELVKRGFLVFFDA